VRRLLALVALLGATGTLRAQTAAPEPRRLSLVEALDIAEAQSEAVGIARQDVARAQGERRRARSAYFPQLSGNASYQRTLRSQFSALQSDATTGPPPEECPSFSPRPGLTVEERLDSLEAAVSCASTADPFAGLGGDLPFGRENTYRFGLSFSQNLFTGGRISGQAAAAGAGLRSASVGLTSARAQLLLDVTQAYYDAVLGDRLVAIAIATLEQADTTLSQTQLARNVGNQSEFDLLRARVTRDNQRPVVIQRQAARDLAYDRLRQMLNLPLSQPVALTTELGDTALVHPARLAELVDTPADTSPDVRAPVRQADEAVRSQEALLRVARAQQWPQLTLSSDYAEFGYPGDVSPFGTNYLSDWAVTLGLQIPLFTGGRIRGDREVARANLEQSKLRLRQTRELAQVDARSAQLQLAAAEAAWQASSGTEEQATRAYQIAEVRYREGISTQTELNELRIQQAQAQVNRAQAARDLQVARMRLALLPALPLAAPATAAATGAGPVPSSGTGPGPGTAPATTTPAAQAGGVLTSTTVTGVAGQ
jgi:outer membrane protein TolC